MSGKARSRFQRLAVLGGVLAAAILAGAGQTMPDGRPTPSGQPVPRWLSLKSDEVRARYGPGLDYRILWEYRVSGLPVQVVAETTEWRKICDPEGNVAWVHRSVVSSRRSAFNASDAEVPIRSGPGACGAMCASAMYSADRTAPCAVQAVPRGSVVRSSNGDASHVHLRRSRR